MTPYRERDFRNMIADLLEQTGAFDGVYRRGLPEDSGLPSADHRVVAIEPYETTEADPWDDAGGDLLLTCRVNLIFLARHEDPQLRDELAEQLLCTASAALSGQSLAGAAVPGRTRVRSWTWRPPVAPERRITAVLEYQYLVDGPAGFNTNE